MYMVELQYNTIYYLLEIVTSIIRELPGGSKKASADPIQVEILFGVYTYLVRLRDILEKHKVLPGTAVLFRLIRKMLRSMRIPFSGEPLAGLQVLGILETRTLDFDNVIVLSANEGTLPKPSEKPSFIPYNLRAGFGLPTPEHHDAIYAYYFYRLIQRARKVALVYDASSGGLQTGERSRFLHQLFYEMKPGIEELQVGSSISQIPVKSVIIHKTGEVIKTLSGYLGDSGRSFSPSAINEFLNCPVKFYFHYIAGLPQPKEVAEDVDARLFGNLIHNSLRRIYEQFGKELVTGEKIRTVRNDEELIYNAIDRAFCEELFGDKDGTGNRKPAGYNLLVRQVLFTYIKQFLNTEINSAPFIVRSLEERHYVSIPIVAIGRESKVTVGGVIDRIDQKDNSLRILDYKTGGVKDRFNSVESLFSGGEKERNDAVFQVLLYSYVYDKLHPGENIVPGLFFLRQCHQDNFSASIEMGNRKKLEDYSMVGNEFEIRLKVALEELFNLEVPFVQTSNLKTCRYCPYAGICRR